MLHGALYSIERSVEIQIVDPYILSFLCIEQLEFIYLTVFIDIFGRK